MNLLQQSWKITWKNKILWIYGLILSISAGIFIFLDQTGKGGEKMTVSEIKALEVEMQIFAERHWMGIIIAMIVALIILGSIIWVSVISKIGLIHETGVIAQNNGLQYEPANIKRGWKKGKEKFWRAVGLDVLVAVAEFIVIIAVKTPLNTLYKNGALSIAIPLTAFAVLILIPFILMFFSIQILGLRKIILDDKKIFQAISEAYDLFVNHWKKIVLTLLALVSTIIVSGFFYVIICSILLLPIAVIALVLSILIGMGSEGLSLGVLVFMVPSVPLCVFFAMIALVFQESTWSVLYQKIKRISVERSQKEIR